MKATDLKNKKMKDLVLCNMRHDWDEETQSWGDSEITVKHADYEIGNGFVGGISGDASMTHYNLWISREEALLHVSAAELKELGYE